MAGPAGLRIRGVEERDAEAMMGYMQRLTNEPHNNITTDPGQWRMTVEEERAFLARRKEDGDKGVMVVATMGEEVVGAANLERGGKATNRHAGSLGISVDAAWRGKGIGTALMEHLLAGAREQGLVRIELRVFTRNPVARRLYEKFGFVEEGRHPYAWCKQGVWVEEVTMGLILRPEAEGRAGCGGGAEADDADGRGAAGG